MNRAAERSWNDLISAASQLGERLVACPERGAALRLKDRFFDVFSPADGLSESLVVDLVTQHYPGDGVESEEGTHRETTTGAFWVIDPIDGTVNYSKGDLTWGICLARVVDDRVERSLLVYPELGVTAEAIRGQGTRVNGVELLPPSLIPAADWVLCMKFGNTPEQRLRHAQLSGELLRTVRDVRRSGCSSWDLVQLARGVWDGYLASDVFVWDYLAASLVLTEVGLETVEYPSRRTVRTPKLVAGHRDAVRWLSAIPIEVDDGEWPAPMPYHLTPWCPECVTLSRTDVPSHLHQCTLTPGSDRNSTCQ